MTLKRAAAGPNGKKTGASDLLGISLPQSPADYLDIFRFRWYWLVIGLVVGSVASQIAIRHVPKQYVSRTVVVVESDKIPKNFIPQLTTDDSRDRLRTINEEILARPAIEQQILDKLNPYPELVDVPRADLVDMIRSKTGIGLKGKDTFVVEYHDTNPVRAQQIASGLASAFIERTTGSRTNQVQQASRFIDSQLDETKAEMEQKESALKQIKQRYMGMLPNQLEANLSTLQRLEMQRQSIEEQIRSTKERKGLVERQLALQSQMTEPEAQLVPEGPLVPQAGGSVSPDQSSLAALKAHLAELLNRYTDAHPDVVATRAKIAKLEKEIADASTKAPASRSPAPTPGAPQEPAPGSAEASAPTDGTTPTVPAPGAPPPALDHATFLVSELQAQVSSITRDLEALEARQEETQKDIARYQARVEKIPEVEQNLQSLERDYSLISKYYGDLLSRKLEAETASAVEHEWKADQFRILDPAQVPISPEYPKPSLFLLVGSLAGIGVGVALAFLFEIMDTAVKNMHELEGLLPYPVLITLPEMKLKKGLLRRRRSEPIAPPPPAPASVTEKVKQDLSA
jgi:uncharacterized protein involved in exopolysaccharide biosynthesis